MPDQELREVLASFLAPDRDAKVKEIGVKDGLPVLINFDLVKRENDVVSFWIWTDRQDPEADFSVTKIEMNVLNKTFRIVSTWDFLPGREVFDYGDRSVTDLPSPWEPIRPGTIVDRANKLLCGEPLVQ